MQTNCDFWQTLSMYDFFPNVPLALLWWCKGAVTPVLQGAAQPPAPSLLSRLFFSSCFLCVRFAMLREFILLDIRWKKETMSECVWARHNFLLLPVVTVHVCVSVCVCQATPCWALGFCGQHSPATHVAEVGPSQRSTFKSSSLSDLLAGSTSPCSRLSEHVF